jgi:tellurite resistance protein
MGVSAAVDVARGKNVGASLLNQGLQFAKTQLPGGPLVGQAFDVGVGAIRGAATGQSFKTIAREAAINAVPGGDLGKAGVRAAFDIAQGKNVGQTLLREGMSAVASQLPAGALVQQAGGAVIDIAKGKNVGQVFASNVGPLARNLVASGAVNIGQAGAALQFTGVNPAQAVSAVKAVTRAAGSQIPSVRNAAAQVLANTRAQAVAGNPGSRIAFNAISKNIRSNIERRAAPTMRQISTVRRTPALRRVA